LDITPTTIILNIPTIKDGITIKTAIFIINLRIAITKRATTKGAPINITVNDTISDLTKALKSIIITGIDPGLMGIDPEGVAPGMGGLNKSYLQFLRQLLVLCPVYNLQNLG
jgi:hypothetical protein